VPLVPAAADPRVALAEEPSEEWIALWGESRGARDLGLVRALLCGSPGRAIFARLGDVAVGRAVVDGEWLGITSMLTTPAARRRGFGRAILASLLAWGAAAGAQHGFLQTDNPAAAALYARLGFRERYTYRYHVAP
jgi:GNAT superfamily N-acetyltransferase